MSQGEAVFKWLPVTCGVGGTSFLSHINPLTRRAFPRMLYLLSLPVFHISADYLVYTLLLKALPRSVVSNLCYYITQIPKSAHPQFNSQLVQPVGCIFHGLHSRRTTINVNVKLLWLLRCQALSMPHPKPYDTLQVPSWILIIHTKLGFLFCG